MHYFQGSREHRPPGASTLLDIVHTFTNLFLTDKLPKGCKYEQNMVHFRFPITYLGVGILQYLCN